MSTATAASVVQSNDLFQAHMCKGGFDSYTTFNDVICTSLGILIEYRGITLSQVSGVTKISPNTLRSIFECRPRTSLSINIMDMIAGSILRMTMQNVTDMGRAAENALRLSGVEISGSRRTGDMVRVNHDRLYKELRLSIIAWATGEGLLRVDLPSVMLA